MPSPPKRRRGEAETKRRRQRKKRQPTVSSGDNTRRLRARLEGLSPEAVQLLATLAAAGQPLGPGEWRDRDGREIPDPDRTAQELLAAGLAAGDAAKRLEPRHELRIANGTVHAHVDGYGFVITAAGRDDIYLDSEEMLSLMNGDEVLVQVQDDRGTGRSFGILLAIVRRGQRILVGRLVEGKGERDLVPDNARLGDARVEQDEQLCRVAPGAIVVGEITRYPAAGQPLEVRLLRQLDDSHAAGLAAEIAVLQFDLPEDFSPTALAEAQRFGERIDAGDCGEREDLRALPLVTIDGADARDFDDAVYGERHRSGWRLVVAIADVASYVRPGSALDEDALQRGTSVYFPTRVLPMLPEALSNGLCSLRPDEDRLALVCDMLLDARGGLLSARHYAAVIRSHARLTYDQAQALLEAREQPPSARVASSLDALYRIYRLQEKQRAERGALAIERPEPVFLWAADGTIDSIEQQSRLTSHKLIEESMILANVATARYLERKRQPALYRVHAPPRGRKLEELEQLLRERAIRPTWRDEPAPADFARLLEACRERADADLIEEALLRAQSLAVYAPQNDGHFGLALNAYCHFTSPIRRYPDLVVHRAVHALLRGQPASCYLPGADSGRALQRLAEHCSMTERRAEEASREVDWRLVCDYMRAHIGDEFRAVVTGVKPFGLFVDLRHPPASGLVHVSQMGRDYFSYDERSQQLRGRRGGAGYGLADAVRVQLIDVDLAQRKLNFRLLGRAA